MLSIFCLCIIFSETPCVNIPVKVFACAKASTLVRNVNNKMTYKDVFLFLFWLFTYESRGFSADTVHAYFSRRPKRTQSSFSWRLTSRTRGELPQTSRRYPVARIWRIGTKRNQCCSKCCSENNRLITSCQSPGQILTRDIGIAIILVTKLLASE